MSRLTALELENFMSIGSARVEFGESNIIDLCGYNDSGKSAITRALEVIFYNSYSTEHVKFIKEGEERFGIGLEFDDGVDINRFKFDDGKSIWEMYKDKKLVYTNKLENGVAAVGDIPEPIAKYLGVIKDEHTGEKLNVRRNTDRLFLINTTGGDNYKILNSILRSDVLAEASKKINEDKNKLQTEVTTIGTSCQTLKNELDSIEVVDEGILNEVDESIKNLGVSNQRNGYFKAIAEQKEILDSFTTYDELTLIDTGKIKGIIDIYGLKKDMEMVIHPEVSKIDTSRLQLLEQVIQQRGKMEGVVQPQCGLIDASRYEAIMNVGMLYNELWGARNSVNEVDQEYKVVLSKLQELAQNHGFKICKNCGTVVV